MKKINAEPLNESSDSFSKCTDQALRFLALREHNCSELSQKLLKKGYDAGTIATVLENLKTDGSIDEKRYIEAFVRSNNRRHPEGKSIVRSRLLAKGTDRSICSEVLDEIYSDEYVCSLREMFLLKMSLKEKNSDYNIVREKMRKAGL